MKGWKRGEADSLKTRLDPGVYSPPMHAMHEKSTMQLLDAASRALLSCTILSLFHL
jgi:hypothetical protein